jgi:hypothetical protein
MISEILILRTEQQEAERKKALSKVYEDFFEQLNNMNEDIKFAKSKSKNKSKNNTRRDLIFLNIDLRDKEYHDASQYMVSINTDSEINKYGVSCADIVSRINELMLENCQPYKCTYSLDWYSGNGFWGFFKKLQCKYPYVKSVRFVLNTVSYCGISSGAGSSDNHYNNDSTSQ